MITIITVVYNGEKTIRDTIESVCRQTVLPSEYLIIDGLSTDGTQNIVEEYTSRYSFIKLISEKDRGIYDAMNKGIQLASGQLIGMINSDDWYEPTAIETMTQAYKEQGSGVYYGILRYLADDQEYYLERPSHRFPAKRMIPHPTTFVTKDIYEANGCFDLKYRYSSDLDFIIRLYKAGVPFHPVDNIIANFRIGGASYTTKAKIEALKVRRAWGLITDRQVKLTSMLLRARSLFK
jgi:glycosyltransferase involved in cell wall biosynthesis